MFCTALSELKAKPSFCAAIPSRILKARLRLKIFWAGSPEFFVMDAAIGLIVVFGVISAWPGIAALLLIFGYFNSHANSEATSSRMP